MTTMVFHKFDFNFFLTYTLYEHNQSSNFSVTKHLTQELYIYLQNIIELSENEVVSIY